MRYIAGKLLVWFAAAFISPFVALTLGAPFSLIYRSPDGTWATIAAILVFPGVLTSLLVFLNDAAAHGPSRRVAIRCALYGFVPTAILCAGFFIGFGPMTPYMALAICANPQRAFRMVDLLYFAPALLATCLGMFAESRLRGTKRSA